MKLNIKNKLKLVKQVLHDYTSKDLRYIKREVITLDDAEFWEELDKLKKEIMNEITTMPRMQ